MQNSAKSICMGFSIILAAVLMLTGTANARTTADDGLVAYWTMDEGQGSVIKDRSGNGIDGTIHGGAKWVDGRCGKALEFNGIDSYVDCGKATNLSISNEITISAWVKPYSLKGGCIVNRYSGDNGGYMLTHAWRGDGFPYLYIRDANTGKVYNSVAGAKLKINEWHHLACMAKRGERLKLYIDGVPAGDGSARDMPFNNEKDNLVIGLYGNLSAKERAILNGAIDSIKIYNRALTLEEIEKNETQAIPAAEVNQTKLAVQRLLSRINALLAKDSRNAYLANAREATLALQARVNDYAGHTDALTLVQFTDISKNIPEEILNIGKVIAGIKNGKILGRDVYVFAGDPITNKRIKPDAVFISDNTAQRIKIQACPGEYEPASLIVYSARGINGLLPVVTDLKSVSGNHIIPRSSIDIGIVKWWYQSGDGVIFKSGKCFIPELILHDDSLVKVDEATGDNLLKLAYPDGAKYTCISGRHPLPGIGTRPSLEAFPVKDASQLMPVVMAKGTNKQYWFTVKVPQDAAPGTYRGKIALTAGGKAVAAGGIDLEVEVLPIKLAEPYYTSSIYYRGYLGANGGTISSEAKSKEQLEAELRDMYEHGVTNPTCYQTFDKALLGEHLAIRQKVGIKGPLYYLGLIRDRNIYPLAFSTGSAQSKNAQQAMIKRIKELSDFTKPYGVSDVYIYGVDEAVGDRLSKEREGWQAIHDAGAKIFVAGQLNMNCTLMADIQDLMVCSGIPNRSESKAWHDKGHKVWSYANPQGGVEEPETYRRNYGLLLWQNGYDGACTYAYQNGSEGTLTWNDFEDQANSYYRHHNMTYPTVDGVIDTVQWEGYREGVDDVRYLSTLIDAVQKAKASKNREAAKTAEAAEKYLAELKAADLSTRDLSAIRSEITGYILKLGK